MPARVSIFDRERLWSPCEAMISTAASTICSRRMRAMSVSLTGLAEKIEADKTSLWSDWTTADNSLIGLTDQGPIWKLERIGNRLRHTSRSLDAERGLGKRPCVSGPRKRDASRGVATDPGSIGSPRPAYARPFAMPAPRRGSTRVADGVSVSDNQ